MADAVRVLHVDEDSEFASLTRAFLEREIDDISVDSVADAPAGLDRLEEREYDCILSDYDMAGSNGIEFLTAVRDSDSRLPFILFTGKGSEEVASEAISAGVTDYLQKEVGTSQFAVLANRIENAVDQYRARKAVAETEQKLAEIAEESDDVLFMVDGDFSELLFINSAHEELWDVEALEADPLSFLEAVPEADRGRVRRAIEGAERGEPGGIDFRLQAPSGEWRWVHAEARPIEEDGEVVRIVGFLRDITGRKEREADLKRTERQYKAIFNDPNILVGLIDPDGSVRDINRTAMDYVDTTVEALRGTPFWETPWFSHSQEVKAEIKACIDRAGTGEYVDFELDLERPNGEPYTVEGVFRPVRNEDDEVISLVISDRDITDRKRRERELERIRERTELALEHTDTMIFEVDAPTGDVTRLGTRTPFFEYPPNGPKWQYHLERAVHPDDGDSVSAFYESLTSGRREEGTLVYRILSQNGTVRWIKDTIRAVSDENTGRRLVGLAQDITEETERQHELEATRERLNLALSAGNIGIWEWHEDGDAVVWSASLERLLGISPGEGPTTARACLAKVHPDDRDHVERALKRAVETDGRFDIELRIEAADGSYCMVAFRGESIASESHERRLLGVVTDITDRRRYRRRLEQVQERTRELMHTQTAEETASVAVRAAAADLEATAAGFFRADPDDVLRPMAFEDPESLFEEPPQYRRDSEDDAPGAFVWSIFEAGAIEYVSDINADERSPDDRPVRSAILFPMGQQGLFIASSNEPHAFEEADRALLEILVNALTEGLDRTDREEELRDRESQIEAINEVTREVFAANTPDEIAAIGARASNDVLGLQATGIFLQRDEPETLTPIAMVDPDGLIDGDPPPLRAGESVAWRAFEQDELLVFDDVRGDPDIHNQDTAIRSEIILPLDDHGVLMAGSRDRGGFDDRDLAVTEMLGRNLSAAFDQVNRKMALEERTERLATQNERLEEFASIVSHDLRNPLNVAMGRLELARETGDTEHLVQLERVLGRMESLIADLLTMARHGDSVTSTEPVDLADLAENCWQTVETADASLDVPSSVSIEADPSRCRQLFENFYRNAVEHGGADVSVRVGPLEAGFFVEDDGPGIPPEDRDRIFDAGYTTEPEGTGFGLRIVEHIVDAHDWSIAVANGNHGGARFEITGVTVLEE